MKLGMLGLFLALGAGSASALDIKTGNSPEGQAADLATGALTTQLGMEAEKLAEQSAPAQPSTGPAGTGTTRTGAAKLPPPPKAMDNDSAKEPYQEALIDSILYKR